MNIINRFNPFGELSDPFKDDFFRNLASVSYTHLTLPTTSRV